MMKIAETHTYGREISFYETKESFYMDEKIEALAGFLKEAENIAFFGGAGVSTESGLKDYRSKDGIYFTAKNFGRPPEEILSRDCFFGDTELFYKFYREFFLSDALPGAAHKALARLENDGKNVTVITQNIDGLHKAAGSRKVIELHGTSANYTCLECGKKYTKEQIKNDSRCVPKCACGGVLKPDVVLYGEQLDNETLSSAARAIASADLLIIGGTSMAVYPAAGLVRFFSGKHIAVINRDSTPLDSRADLVFHQNIGEVLERVLR